VTPALAVTLLGLGTLGAFVAGLLGVGGALVMVPLLLYVPPLLGVGVLDIKSVASVTIVQVFVAALSGVAVHRRYQAVNRELTWVGGLAMAVASFAGALASKYLHDRWLLLVFAFMATSGVVLLAVPLEALLPPPAVQADGALHFSRARTGTVAAVVGFAAGLVGVGGAFLLVPLLFVVVGVPIRVTIGSSLAITALAATAGLAGKLLTGQVPGGPALAVALGALPGAWLGAAVSRRLAEPQLKAVLLGLVVTTAAWVWWDVVIHWR
jgi:uncharacterized membrane protein YfcA